MLKKCVRKYGVRYNMDSMNLNRKYLSTWALSPEDEFMRDLGNFLRENKISIYKEDGTYRGFEAIIAEVRSKFEKS